MTRSEFLARFVLRNAAKYEDSEYTAITNAQAHAKALETLEGFAWDDAAPVIDDLFSKILDAERLEWLGTGSALTVMQKLSAVWKLLKEENEDGLRSAIDQVRAEWKPKPG
jgi:hypothetical protein